MDQSQNSLPKVAARHPYTVELNPDTKYYYCTCGYSTGQPFCDGKCEGTDFKPIEFTVQRKGKALLCGCKRNDPKSLYKCDGRHSHVNLDW